MSQSAPGAQDRPPSPPRERPPSKVALGDKHRILFLNDTSRNGGPGRTLFCLLKFLDTDVIHRSVIVPREGVVTELLRGGGVADKLHLEPGLVENIVEPWSRAIVREDFDAPLPVRAMRAVGNVGRATAAMLRLARFVRRGRFEAIFCNGTSANFAGAALASLTGVPAVWHVFYTSVARPIAALHARLAASEGVKAILCVSRPTTRLFEHCRAKVKITHDAIDVAEFDAATITPRLRDELRLAPDVVVFGSQGRILPRKGYIEMIRAAKRMQETMAPEERARCRFVVLGDTPEDMRPNHLEECRALVSELGLDDMVTFLGYRPDVKPYAVEFDVAVVPSIYEDPLPRVVLESMALGKPVVAFDRGGIPEMIEDAVSGALVPGAPPDVEGLAAAMLRYQRSPELRRRQGTAARARVEELFEASAHAKVLEAEILRVARAQP